MTNFSFQSVLTPSRILTRNTGFRFAILILAAIFVNAASSAQADTYWSDTAPASVADLMTADYWTNCAPTSADNPGFITGKTVTVTNDFKPGANGQNVDLTFGQGSDIRMNQKFVPVANIGSDQNGTVTFRLKDNANVYVSGNFWGGTNDESRTYNNLGEGEYNLYQYYGGNSTFSSGEWWAGMTAKTYILISDNAVVTARSGNSGLGWGSKEPYASYGSVLELTGHGSLNSNGSNMNIWGTDTTVNMYDNSTFSANTLNVSKLTPQVNLYNKSTLTTTGAATVANSGSITANDASKITFGGAGTVNDQGALTVNDNSALTFNGAATVNSQGSVTANDNSTLTFKGATTVNNQGSITANDNSVLTLNNTFKLDNTASLTLNGAAKLTVTNEFALDRNGAMYVNDNVEISFTNPKSNTWKIGDVNAGADGGAIYTQTGGTVTTARTSYFSYHSDATVTISGGKFISTASQLYVADLKGVTGDITLSGDGYLQAKDFRLGQHGNANLTTEGASQISVENLNIAYNHTANDNVVAVVTMGGSSNITASSNMYFFGSNAAGAAYGSLTLNDNASIAIANEVQIGKGSSISLITGKSYAAEITLNGNSVFTAKTFTAKSGAKSATSVNGSATFNADTINIQGESLFNVNGGAVNALTLTNTGTSVTTVSGTGALNAETINIETGTKLNVNGGEVNVTYLNFEGTVNLTGGAINLTSNGLISSTAGTFTGTGGTINVKGSDNVSYTTGDQLLVGLFAQESTANAVAGSTTPPEGWQTAVFTLGDSQAVIASYGDTVPTGVKTWTGAGSDTSMGNADNWDGDASNPTGYVLSGTNTMSGIAGKTYVMGGTNTFNGDMPANTAITFDGGTSYVKGTNYYGSIIVNDGTVDFTGGDRLLMDNAGYLEVNGGEVKITDKWFKSYQDIVVNDGVVNFTGNGLAMKTNSVTTNNGGAVTLSRIIIGDDNAPDGYAASENPSGDFTSKYINNTGTTKINGLVEVAQKNNTVGYFEVNGGSVSTTGDFEVAVGTNSKAYLTVVGDDTSFSTTKKLFLGYNSSAEYKQTGGTVTVSDTTYFSYHGNAKIDISGGKFYANGAQLYVTDQRGRTADIAMSGNAYLQAKDLRLSQHGNTTLTMKDNSHLSVTTFNVGYNYGNGDNVESVILMSGNSKIETSGNFVTFGGNKEKMHNGAAYASLTMKDNAYLNVSGNTWGGSDKASDNNIYGPGLISGKNYNLEMTFTDNSYFSTNEFWMAMTGKAHVIIDENATVIARGGNSGLGWNAKAAGSKLEINGGTFQVDSNYFAVGCMNDTNTPNTGVCNVVQTGGKAIYTNKLLLGQNASTYEISGADAVVTAGNITTQAGSTFRMKGGTVTATTITDAGTLNVSGGTLNAGGIAISANGAIQISGGTIIPGASGITAEGAHTVNLSGGVFTTNGASWTATDITATVADNSTVTFEPESGQTIKWTGALVNNAQNAKIVKDGNGVLKIDSPDINNPTKLESFVVNAGELDFKGYFAGDLEINSGATFSPGNSIGTTYETGTFTLDPGATLLMEIGTDASGNVVSDQLIVDGNIVIGENAMILLTLDPDSSMAPNTSFTVDLISGTAATDETYQAVSNAISSYYFTGINVDYDPTNKVIKLSATLNANAVPEPSTWALMALGVVVLFLRKRVRN